MINHKKNLFYSILLLGCFTDSPFLTTSKSGWSDLPLYAKRATENKTKQKERDKKSEYLCEELLPVLLNFSWTSRLQSVLEMIPTGWLTSICTLVLLYKLTKEFYLAPSGVTSTKKVKWDYVFYITGTNENLFCSC